VESCAPQANGVAERFVSTARSECFDKLLILNQQHLQRTVADTANEPPTDYRTRSRPYQRLLQLLRVEPKNRESLASTPSCSRRARSERLGERFCTLTG
jgi:hypothetical protein